MTSNNQLIVLDPILVKFSSKVEAFSSVKMVMTLGELYRRWGDAPCISKMLTLSGEKEMAALTSKMNGTAFFLTCQ